MAFFNQRNKASHSRLKPTDIVVAIVVIGLAAYLSLKSDNNALVTSTNIEKNSIQSKAIINDGDTITIQSERIRLVDMDAPELHQKCGEKSGKSYACGELSKQYLIKLINGRNVECHWNRRDKYTRPLGYCFVDEDNLNRQMVLDGWAVSYSGFPNEEKEARKNKRGIWKTDFERPKQWRDKNMNQQRRG